MISQFHERRRANRETWLLAHGLYVFFFTLTPALNSWPLADIIRARLQTVSVEEHHFVVEKGGVNSDVYITDVGGSRSQVCWTDFFPFMTISWQNGILSSEASLLGAILWWRWGFFSNCVLWWKTHKNEMYEKFKPYFSSHHLHLIWLSKKIHVSIVWSGVFPLPPTQNADKHYQEDSLNLWRQLCSNRLLAAANLIVFFNKVRSFFSCDIMS